MAGCASRGKKSLDDLHTAAIQWAERRASREPEEAYPLPEDCNFYDLERSISIFSMLETFADGMGGWNIQGVLGQPMIELSETLISDLLTLKRFSGIAERRRDKEKKAAGKK